MSSEACFGELKTLFCFSHPLVSFLEKHLPPLGAWAGRSETLFQLRCAKQVSLVVVVEFLLSAGTRLIFRSLPWSIQAEVPKDESTFSVLIFARCVRWICKRIGLICFLCITELKLLRGRPLQEARSLYILIVRCGGIEFQARADRRNRENDI